MKPEDIKPGVTIEWAHTPNFTVFSRLIIDRIEDGYVWLHFEDTGTINRLAISAIQRRGRLALATGREVEWLKRLVRQYVDPTEVGPGNYDLVAALKNGDEEAYRKALDK